MTDLPKRGSREFNALVAKEIMGRIHGYVPSCCTAADDYSVLVKVREWSALEKLNFVAAYEEIVTTEKRGGFRAQMSDVILRYEPGDYAEAALRVMMSKD